MSGEVLVYFIALSIRFENINLKSSGEASIMYFEAKTLNECVEFLSENENEGIFKPFDYRVEQFNPKTKEVEQGINAALLLRIFKETKERGNKLPLLLSDIKTYL